MCTGMCKYRHTHTMDNPELVKFLLYRLIPFLLSTLTVVYVCLLANSFSFGFFDVFSLETGTGAALSLLKIHSNTLLLSISLTLCCVCILNILGYTLRWKRKGKQIFVRFMSNNLLVSESEAECRERGRFRSHDMLLYVITHSLCRLSY